MILSLVQKQRHTENSAQISQHVLLSNRIIYGHRHSPIAASVCYFQLEKRLVGVLVLIFIFTQTTVVIDLRKRN